MEGKLNDYHSFSGTVESHEKRLNEELENDAHGNNNFVDHTDEESDNKKLMKMKKQLKHDYHHLQESVQMLEQTVCFYLLLILAKLIVDTRSVVVDTRNDQNVGVLSMILATICMSVCCYSQQQPVYMCHCR